MIAIFECRGDKTHAIAENHRGILDARTLTTQAKAEVGNREITGSRTGAIEDVASATVHHKMLEFKFSTSSFIVLSYPYL